MINQGIGYLTARIRYSGNEYIQATQISEAKRPEILSAKRSASTIDFVSAMVVKAGGDPQCSHDCQIPHQSASVTLSGRSAPEHYLGGMSDADCSLWISLEQRCD